MFIYPLIAAMIIAADQASKYAVRTFMQPGDRIPIIGDWFSLYYVRNTGTAFSMFAGNRMITVALTSVLVIACLIFIIIEARKGERITALFVTMIFAGGVSNLIDRLVLGYVTDMISCWSFAVFNVADIFITCSCFILVIYLMTTLKDDPDDQGKHSKKL